MNRIIIVGMSSGEISPARLLEEATRIARKEKDLVDGESYTAKLFDFDLSVKYNKGILSIKGEPHDS